MEYKDILARNIQLLRWSRGWSQEELADRADIYRSHVSAIEHGRNNAQLDSMVRVAKAFGIDLLDLLRPETADLIEQTDVESRRPRPGRKATATVPRRRKPAPPAPDAES